MRQRLSPQRIYHSHSSIVVLECPIRIGPRIVFFRIWIFVYLSSNVQNISFFENTYSINQIAFLNIFEFECLENQQFLGVFLIWNLWAEKIYSIEICFKNSKKFREQNFIFLYFSYSLTVAGFKSLSCWCSVRNSRRSLENLWKPTPSGEMRRGIFRRAKSYWIYLSLFKYTNI